MVDAFVLGYTGEHCLKGRAVGITSRLTFVLERVDYVNFVLFGVGAAELDLSLYALSLFCLFVCGDAGVDECFFHFFSALTMSSGRYLRCLCLGLELLPTLMALSLPELSHRLRVSGWTLRMRAASLIEIYFVIVEL